MKLFYTIFLILFGSILLPAQTVLSANGEGNTYELINSVFAPNYNVVETPDCSHPDFGNHISEIWDSTLNKFVFQFHAHVQQDDDRCINFDRQRTEIKTYDKSPDNLLAVKGETVEYKWKFKIDNYFKPSKKFTHLHQLKAVDGSENSIPQITLTARKGNPDRMELRYAEHSSSTNLTSNNLAHFKGFWVECIERVTFGEMGSYEIIVKRLLDNKQILYYKDDAIRMWKTDAAFIRPKWGIYRSLEFANDLRDEIVLFADFSIEEIDVTNTDLPKINIIGVYPNPVSDLLTIIGKNSIKSIRLVSLQGETIFTKSLFSTQNRIPMSDVPDGLYLLEVNSFGQQKDWYKIVVSK